jgi:4-amino-4-deoxy-L-arabinose transferase-like glycosyltransferase
MFSKLRESKRFREWLPLAIILVAGLAVRLTFFTGMVRGDALNYSHAAYALTRGVFDLDAWAGMSRVGLIFPTAALYMLFGPSEVATLFFPVFCSLLSIVFIYALTKMYAGETAGLLAALLWAFLALDVHLATNLLTDGPVAAFSTGSVYFFLCAKKALQPKKVYLYALSVFFLIWGLLTKPIAFPAVLLYFAILTGLNNWKGKNWFSVIRLNQKRLLAFIVLTLLIGLALVIMYSQIQPRPLILSLVRTNNDLGRFFFTGYAELFADFDITNSDLLVYIAPLFLISTLTLLLEKGRKYQHMILWAGVLFLYYELGTFNLNPLNYRPLQSFHDGRYMLFMLAPLIVLAGIYLGRNLRGNLATGSIAGIAVICSLIGWLTKEQLYKDISTNWTSFSSMFAVMGAILSPIFLQKRHSVKTRIGIVSLYLVALCLSMLEPVPPYHALMYRDRIERLGLIKKTISFWQDHRDYPIYVPSSGDATWLSYGSNFSLGYDWAGTHIPGQGTRITYGLPPENQSAYILWSSSATAPDNWWRQANFVGATTEVSIYRVLAPQEVQIELNLALDAANRAGSKENLERLYGAAINAESWGIVVDAWLSLNNLDPENYPLSEFATMLQKPIYSSMGSNLFLNSDFTDGMQDWIYSETQIFSADQTDPHIISTFVENDTSGLSQEVLLQPRGVYLFQITLKTGPELFADILRVDDGSIVDTIQNSEVFNNFTHTTAIFVTPDWPEGPRVVSIALYSTSGEGMLWIQDPMLMQLGFPEIEQ